MACACIYLACSTCTSDCDIWHLMLGWVASLWHLALNRDYLTWSLACAISTDGHSIHGQHKKRTLRKGFSHLFTFILNFWYFCQLTCILALYTITGSCRQFSLFKISVSTLFSPWYVLKWKKKVMLMCYQLKIPYRERRF